jgi:hypothetical protein
MAADPVKFKDNERENYPFPTLSRYNCILARESARRNGVREELLLPKVWADIQ